MHLNIDDRHGRLFPLARPIVRDLYLMLRSEN
jgi:hypothetical protein